MIDSHLPVKASTLHTCSQPIYICKRRDLPPSSTHRLQDGERGPSLQARRSVLWHSSMQRCHGGRQQHRNCVQCPPTLHTYLRESVAPPKNINEIYLAAQSAVISWAQSSNWLPTSATILLAQICMSIAKVQAVTSWLWTVVERVGAGMMKICDDEDMWWWWCVTMMVLKRCSHSVCVTMAHGGIKLYTMCATHTISKKGQGDF